MKKNTFMFRLMLYAVILTSMLGIFSGCRNYGHKYDYRVVGEGGTICMIWNDIEFEAEFSPRDITDGKKVNHDILFLAIPDDGYCVKQWTHNGKVVEGNKTNEFTLPDHPNTIGVYITVEFELKEPTYEE